MQPQSFELINVLLMMMLLRVMHKSNVMGRKRCHTNRPNETSIGRLKSVSDVPCMTVIVIRCVDVRAGTACDVSALAEDRKQYAASTWL